VQSVDGVAVDDMQSLNYRTATHRPGDNVKMHVAQGKAARDVNVTLALPPETPPRDTTTIGGRNPLTGARVMNISPASATELQMDVMAKGVAILSVNPSGIAANYGFSTRRYRARHQWQCDRPRRRAGTRAQRHQSMGHGD
jgi:serine protease Do